MATTVATEVQLAGSATVATVVRVSTVPAVAQEETVAQVGCSSVTVATAEPGVTPQV